jgi:putative transposase
LRIENTGACASAFQTDGDFMYAPGVLWTAAHHRIPLLSVMHNNRAPKYLSSDHDPLYRFHQWQANLRVLGVTEVKTVPYVPLSHPFVERLIGTIRGELLDHVLFWTGADLESKLSAFQTYYNRYRTHASLKGQTPIQSAESSGLNFKSYRWRQHCRGLYQTPTAA